MSFPVGCHPTACAGRQLRSVARRKQPDGDPRPHDRQRVAHFAEVDAQAERLDAQALLLRPAARLIGAIATRSRSRPRARGRREALAVPPGFAALRDGKSTDHELLETCGRGSRGARRSRRGRFLPTSSSSRGLHGRLDTWLRRDMTAARDLRSPRWRRIAAVHDHERHARGRRADRPQAHRHRRSAAAADQQRQEHVRTKIARDADGLPRCRLLSDPVHRDRPACAYTSLVRSAW